MLARHFALIMICCVALFCAPHGIAASPVDGRLSSSDSIVLRNEKEHKVDTVFTSAKFKTSPLCSSSVPTQDGVEQIFIQKVYFRKGSAYIDNSFHDNSVGISRIHKVLTSDGISDRQIEIVGSASPEGSVIYNTNLATNRALALSELFGGLNAAVLKVQVEKDVDESLWNDCRFAMVRISGSDIVEDTQEISGAIDPEKRNGQELTIPSSEGRMSDESMDFASECTVDSAVVGISDMAEGLVVSESASPAVALKKRPKLFVSTNMLYDAALIPNLGIGVCLGERFSVYADWMCAWWSKHESRKYWRIYGGNMEVRMHLGHGRSSNTLSGHRVGIYASLINYDIQFGRSHTGIISDNFNYAAGLSYAYSLPIARRLNIEFSVNFGYMWGRYEKHRPIDDHDVWISSHKRSWLGPTGAGVSLVWLIGSDIYNIGKGDRR